MVCDELRLEMQDVYGGYLCRRHLCHAMQRSPSTREAQGEASRHIVNCIIEHGVPRRSVAPRSLDILAYILT